LFKAIQIIVWIAFLFDEVKIRPVRTLLFFSYFQFENQQLII